MRSHVRRTILAAAAVVAVGVAPLLIAAPAVAAASDVVINEVESNGDATDWVELINTGAGPVDVSGWILKDDNDSRTLAIPAGTVLAPGAFLAVDVDPVPGGFGLGGADMIRVFEPGATTPVDSYAWTAHAATTYGRCPDGTGAFVTTLASTKGAANACEPAEEPEPVDGAILINEIDSQPADWVELVNLGTEALDIAGYEIRDNSDDHRWRFPAGASIVPGDFLVVEEGTIGLVLDGGSWVPGTFGSAIGIGSADQIHLYDAAGTKIDESEPWTAHAAIDGDAATATLARCPDGIGAFRLAYATKGATNSCVPPSVAINEINSRGGPSDWVEIVNTGSAAVDVSGWTVMDNDPVGHASGVTPLPAGTVLAPGALLVLTEGTDFSFGLGNGDTVTLRDAGGSTVDEHVYAAHAAGFWARCPDGTGPFGDVAVGTPGAVNDCGSPVRINEIESSGGIPGDWIELVNPTDAPLDVAGIVVKDDDDAHAYAIPAGTTIPAGGYLVLEEADFGFGLGGGDSVRLFDGAVLIDATTWPAGHPATSWGRCPDATGAFAETAEPTKGAANRCPGEIEIGPWPGGAEVTVVDTLPTFLADSSGLDVQHTADGDVLWAIDNGTGRFWKLLVASDGSVALAPGWEDGKRIRFQKDAGSPAAPGPDTEGITVDGDGFVYAASERDNGAKGVNWNVVLKVDPDTPGPDLVALQEWDLTAALPPVGANLGMEAVEWVPDSELAGLLWDDAAGAPYDPAAYPGHGDGLFFVAIEDGGLVFAFAFYADGTFAKVGELHPGLSGVMALDYDVVLGVLWAVCDDGCGGTAAMLTFTGAPAPDIAHVARPAGMPNINNEGFATGVLATGDGDVRPVWWFADGFESGALRVGTLPGGLVPEVETPVEAPAPAAPLTATGSDTGWAGPAALAALLLLAAGALALRRSSSGR